MAGLVYYLPGKGAVSEKNVLDAGLGYAYVKKLAHVGMSSGPDGKSGAAFLLAEGSLAPLADAATRRKTWTQIPNSAAWVGYDPDNRPAPAELARAERIGGHMTRLADGQEWLVPVARELGGGSALPRRLSWDGASWTPGDVLPQYRRLWEAACRAFDQLLGVEGHGDMAMLLSEECDLAAQALCCNYRVGPAEISLLGLFATGTQAAVIGSLIDLPTMAMLQKKTPAAPGSKPGGGG